MTCCLVENIASFEQFNLNLVGGSWVRFLNHRFSEDTIIENMHSPGLHISMLGTCQGVTKNSGMDPLRDYSYQYMVTLVDQPCFSQMQFHRDTTWQTLSIILPLDALRGNIMIPEFWANFSHAVPQIQLAELGPVSGNILRCCEAVWNCPLQGLERGLFIQAKAQEVLALFLHQRHQQKMIPDTARLSELSKVMSYIQANLAQEWRLSKVARLAASNQTYVKQDIKTLVGLNFSDWLRQTRLEVACEQLAGCASITQISLNVGFKSQAHFATSFKNEIGISPSEYRQSLVQRQVS